MLMENLMVINYKIDILKRALFKNKDEFISALQ